MHLVAMARRKKVGILPRARRGRRCSWPWPVSTWALRLRQRASGVCSLVLGLGLVIESNCDAQRTLGRRRPRQMLARSPPARAAAGSALCQAQRHIPTVDGVTASQRLEALASTCSIVGLRLKRDRLTAPSLLLRDACRTRSGGRVSVQLSTGSQSHTHPQGIRGPPITSAILPSCCIVRAVGARFLDGRESATRVVEDSVPPSPKLQPTGGLGKRAKCLLAHRIGSVPVTRRAAGR